MSFTGRLSALLLAGLLGPLASTACAGVIVGINFDGDTLGLPPGVTSPAGNPVVQPTAIGAFGGPAGSVLVGNVSTMSKAAVLTSDPADITVDAALGSRYVDINGINLVAQTIQVSFDLAILAAPANATIQPKNLDGGGTAGIILGLNTFLHDSSPGFRFAAAPTSAGGGVFAFRSIDNSTLFPFFDYVEGQTYGITIVADYSSGTLKAFVDGVELLSNFQFLASGRSNVGTSELFFHLNGEPGQATSAAIDNISAFEVVAAEVPEPASIAVWSLVSIAAGVAYRRRRKKTAA